MKKLNSPFKWSKHTIPPGQIIRKHITKAVEWEREREMFYLTTHSTHFIYGYMASDIWLRTILIVRKKTCCRHMGYSYRLTARVLLYAPSHRQDNTYHGLCYTSHGALAGTRNSSMGPPYEGSIRRPTAPWANAVEWGQPIYKSYVLTHFLASALPQGGYRLECRFELMTRSARFRVSVDDDDVPDNWMASGAVRILASYKHKTIIIITFCHPVNTKQLSLSHFVIL